MADKADDQHRAIAYEDVMKTNFRQEAQDAWNRAKAELNSTEDARLRYAALELRLAMAALVYDMAQAFKSELPKEDYKARSPRKVMTVLGAATLPNVGKRATLNIKFWEGKKYGCPMQKVRIIGTEDILDLDAIENHYDALGVYLHMPPLEQIEQNGLRPDYQKLRRQCEDVAAEIEAALVAPMFEITTGSFMETECQSCGTTYRGHSPMEDRYFTAAEAQALIGQGLRITIEIFRVPQGTTGAVVCAKEGARGYTVAVKWTQPDRRNPLIDWFSKGEFERFFECIEDRTFLLPSWTAPSCCWPSS